MAKENTSGEILIEGILKKNKILYDSKKRLLDLKKDPKKYRIPDFYLPKYDLCIEYFGSWDLRIGGFQKKERARFLEKIAVYEINKVKCVYLYPNTLKYAEQIILAMIKNISEKGTREKAIVKKEEELKVRESALKMLENAIKRKLYSKPHEPRTGDSLLRHIIFSFAGSMVTLFLLLIGIYLAVRFSESFGINYSVLMGLLDLFRTIFIFFLIVTALSLIASFVYARDRFIIKGLLFIFFIAAFLLVVLSIINVLLNGGFLGGLFLAFASTMLMCPVETYMAWSNK